ncbi:unnamed protein product [Pieris macdunnoughi]|uniref:Uncharacterized protein n=1 Tax=Pieris macdunnoughi TaxID=345717 RepID=A0A821X6H5_9NEOP|nr:unnamed protein product [Pieris macdunnoughi]
MKELVLTCISCYHHAPVSIYACKKKNQMAHGDSDISRICHWKQLVSANGVEVQPAGVTKQKFSSVIAAANQLPTEQSELSLAGQQADSDAT